MTGITGPVGPAEMEFWREKRLDIRFFDRVDEMGETARFPFVAGSLWTVKTIHSGFQSVCPAMRTLTSPSKRFLISVVAGSLPERSFLINRRQ